jgi:hypothetical protein
MDGVFLCEIMTKRDMHAVADCDIARGLGL